MIKKIIICFAVIAVPCTVWSAPVLTTVSGNLVHGQNVSLSGNGFGEKTPAAPLLWDDCTSNPSLSTHYDEYLPDSAQQGTLYNMAYRSLPFRGVTGPNSRVSFVLGGAHAINEATSGFARGGNVMLGKNTTSHRFFINYYYRIDPLFDDEVHPTYTDNMKEIDLSETASSAYGGTFGYYNWCNNDVPDVNQRGEIRLIRMPVTPNNRSVPYGCSGDNQVYHDSPINGWVKMQWEGDYDTANNAPTMVLTTYPDRQKAYQSHYGDALTTDNYVMSSPGSPKAGNLRMVSIGGFARIPRNNNGTNSFRYFGAIYFDTTHARVMLGNNADYNACTILEPQPPLTWSANAISFKVNLGSIPDNTTAYLYVFDSNNLYNPEGLAVQTGTTVITGPQTPRDFNFEN